MFESVEYRAFGVLSNGIHISTQMPSDSLALIAISCSANPILSLVHFFQH